MSAQPCTLPHSLSRQKSSWGQPAYLQQGGWELLEILMVDAIPEPHTHTHLTQPLSVLQAFLSFNSHSSSQLNGTVEPCGVKYIQTWSDKQAPAMLSTYLQEGIIVCCMCMTGTCCSTVHNPNHVSNNQSSSTTNQNESGPALSTLSTNQTSDYHQCHHLHP
jgi:hypothetical protein